MTPQQNEIMTRVGPSTPGGEMLRRYWWPVWLSADLQNKPVEIRVLAEDFVLFRDGSGQAGLLGRYCPHRGASLGLGRAEASGLRCCYHGWLFARNGQCIETPAEPEGSPLKDEVRHQAGHVKEIAGLIFAYIGPEPVPVFPKYDLLFREDCHREVSAGIDHCNWAQRAENGVDPYHSMALHASVYPSIALKRPQVEWTRTRYGFRQSSQYPNKLQNISHHIFPSTTRRHGARVGEIPSEFLHLRTPTDDISTTTFYVKANIVPEGPYKLISLGFKTNERGVYNKVEDGWWDLPSHEQDRAAQESQGVIYDRSKKETLGTSDRGVIMWRKALFDSIQAVQEGRDPLGVLRDEQKNELIIFDAGKNFSDTDKKKSAELVTGLSG